MGHSVCGLSVMYQRTVTAIFHNMIHKKMEDYVNDIVVKSKTRARHLQILEQVLKGAGSTKCA